MVFKLILAVARTMRRQNWRNLLPTVIDGIIFKVGVEDASVAWNDALRHSMRA